MPGPSRGGCPPSPGAGGAWLLWGLLWGTLPRWIGKIWAAPSTAAPREAPADRSGWLPSGKDAPRTRVRAQLAAHACPPPHLRAVYTHTSLAHASVARTRMRLAAHVRAPCTELHARTCRHTLVRACPASTPLLRARYPVLQARCTASAARSSPPASASALPQPQALPAAPWQRSWLARSLPRTRFNGRKALPRV